MTLEATNDTTIEPEFSEDDASDAFAKALGVSDTAEASQEAPKETKGDPELVLEAPETPEDPGQAAETLAADDHLVAITVGDEVRKVPVSDLKRVFAQEAEISGKTTALDTAVQRASAQGELAVSVLSTMLTKAREAFDPYSKIDFADARMRLDDGPYNQLRMDAKAAYDHMVFIESEGQKVVSGQNKIREAALNEAMEACEATLAKDPETPGWGKASREALADYGASVGINRAAVIGMADAASLKIIQKAMKYDAAVAAMKSKVKGVAKTAPTTSIKPGASDGPGARDAVADALSRLRKTGSVDDAQAAFAARFN